MSLSKLNINKNWTLFLDRDGVINTKLDGDYVKNWSEFEFIQGTLSAVKILSQIFGKIIIVTNQQGIGKGLMSQDDLHEIHFKMLNEIEKAGGKIDAIFYAPELATDCNNTRKPKIDMALQAQRIFTDIAFEKSIMLGDSQTDMLFAKNVGMVNVAIFNKLKADFFYPYLIDFAKDLKENLETK